MPTTDYRNSAIQLTLTVVESLSERPLEPLPGSALEAATGGKTDAVFRCLKNLELAGWVEKRPGGWRLSPLTVQISHRMTIALSEAHRAYLSC